jgi:hypothetical protein
MKIKTFIILVIVLGLLVGAGAFVMHLKTPSAPTIAMGSPLVDELPVNDIVTIAIDGVASPVTLTNKGKGWVVEERFDYPADFSRIIEFVRTLKDAKVGRMFVATDADLKRLSLKSPDEKGVSDADRATRVRMRDKKGEILLELLVGDTRTRGERKLPDGQFVALENKPNVYLIDKTLTAYLSGPSDWLAKSPVKVESEAVREIRCLGPDGKTVRFAFKRPAEGKPFELVMPKTDKKIKTPSLNRLAGALSSLDISDVTDPSKRPEGVMAGVSPVLVYTLFNGMSYRVYPGGRCSATTPCYVRFEVSYAPPKAEKPKETDKKSAQKPGPDVLEKEAKAENERVSPWVFAIPEWQHKAFMTDAEKLLESPKEKEKG